MSAWLKSPLRRLRVGAPPVPKRLAFWDDDDDEEEDDGGGERLVNGTAAAAVAITTVSKPLVDATGLVNVGNTCFVNAILQCLAALPSLRAQLEHEMERRWDRNH
uniref:USP domain-containing protein n=1 Tax=Globisporangium ultimum (strain ATCC 200006 / CBS 805.95 / DAOM BR144) TaxID=431595 RepID=K3WV16_GLOUD